MSLITSNKYALPRRKGQSFLQNITSSKPYAKVPRSMLICSSAKCQWAISPLKFTAALSVSISMYVAGPLELLPVACADEEVVLVAPDAEAVPEKVAPEVSFVVEEMAPAAEVSVEASETPLLAVRPISVPEEVSSEVSETPEVSSLTVPEQVDAVKGLNEDMQESVEFLADPASEVIQIRVGKSNVQVVEVANRMYEDAQKLAAGSKEMTNYDIPEAEKKLILQIGEAARLVSAIAQDIALKEQARLGLTIIQQAAGH